MNKYVCLACGYIYDNLEQEVPFEELPDTWTCPECSASKDAFELVIE